MKPTRCHPDDVRDIERMMEYIPLDRQQEVVDEYSFLYQSAPSIAMARSRAKEYLKNTSKAFHIEAYSARRVK